MTCVYKKRQGIGYERTNYLSKEHSCSKRKRKKQTMLMCMTCVNCFCLGSCVGGIIALLMIPRALKLLKNAVKVLLEQTPEGLDLNKVREHLEHVPHVLAVHDLHASTVSTGMPIFMAHVVVDPNMTMTQCSQVLSQLQDCLREHFPVSVSHTTFQLEPKGYTTSSASEHHE